MNNSERQSHIEKRVRNAEVEYLEDRNLVGRQEVGGKKPMAEYIIIVQIILVQTCGNRGYSFFF